MKFPKISTRWITWAAGVLAIGLVSYVYSLFTGQQPNIPVPPAPPDPLFVGSMGWHNNPAEVEKAIKAIEAAQGFRARFGIVGAKLLEAPTNDSVFLWDAETKVLGKLLPSWDQGQVGCCVSFGWGRGVQDLLLLQVANGAAEEWPGHQVATEEIYGGSRVQIGHNQLGREDGSTGAWAGQFVHEYGVLLRQLYPGGINLSTYSESLTRQWGNSGVPEGLLPECRKHAVRGIAQISNSDEAWAALGNGYPIPICSDVGFASPLKNGFCAQSGSWGHCMLLRGRFMHPKQGKCFVIQNSWGNYLKPGPGDDQIDTTDRGKVQLPQGCFATTGSVVDRIVKQGDSFAVSSFEGFPNQKVDWLINRLVDLVSRDAANQERRVAANQTNLGDYYACIIDDTVGSHGPDGQ